MRKFRCVSLSVGLWSGAVVATVARATCPDLALVLAIDGSSSISAPEFVLQQAGYANAFSDRRVVSALASAGVVDVAIVLWGDETLAPQILPWQRLSVSGDAEDLAERIVAMPRQVAGDTGIGRGLWTALDLLEADKPCAARRIINVSGDGEETLNPKPRNHVPVEKARRRARDMRVTINGLAITTAGSDLESWYRDRVITGPDAFVMAVDDFDDFGDAIARKLAREMTLPALAVAGVMRQDRP